jgi:hypothetical protein
LRDQSNSSVLYPSDYFEIVVSCRAAQLQCTFPQRKSISVTADLGYVVGCTGVKREAEEEWGK